MVQNARRVARSGRWRKSKPGLQGLMPIVCARFFQENP